VTVLSYEVVRVFTRNGKNGNGLALFPDGSGLSSETMLKIAARLGFSETSFVLKSSGDADYRARFFTPNKELPFAGHPSIGTLFALSRMGGVKRKRNFTQKIGRRLVSLRLEKDGTIFMKQGKPAFIRKVLPETAAEILGLRMKDIGGEPAVVSTGLPHIIIPLASYSALKRAKIVAPVYREAIEFAKAVAVMPYAVFRGKVRCRMFAPALGITEDPATGSGAGPLAAYIARGRGAGGEIEIYQGTAPDGASLLKTKVSMRGRKVSGVEVGGYCAFVESRELDLSNI